MFTLSETELAKKEDFLQRFKKVQIEAEIKNDAKHGNMKFEYVTLEAILKNMKPIFYKYNMSLMFKQSLEIVNGYTYNQTVAELHDCSSLNSVSANAFSVMDLEKTNNAGKLTMDRSQMAGSAQTYSKRGALVSLLGIIEPNENSRLREFLETTYKEHEEQYNLYFKVNNKKIEKLTLEDASEAYRYLQSEGFNATDILEKKLEENKNAALKLKKEFNM